ncbi:O-antigen export system, permease protein [hydrothermal vent metagenome]|uniref:O-antigen export system, permease protein n=1 Tax=hydrothermal vent metagenome TaxID=652676 RepID=A0A3B0RK63_9ZZZZ
MKDGNWLYTISAKQKLISLNFKEIWRYRDLLLLFVKRDVVTLYKQTILGPLWYVIQPLFTSIIFTLIFNKLANIPTGEGVPPFLFNLAGITSWNYFKECLMGTSDTFKKNQSIFGKVYFPRVIMPLSVVVSNLLKFGIQFLVFIGFYVFFVLVKDAQVVPNKSLIVLPIVILVMALLGLGLGMIVSSMTTKYRDLTFLLQFGIQLLMYGSAVMYPLSYFKTELPKYAWLVEYNPIAIVIETFRNITLSTDVFYVDKFIYAVVFSILIFLLGLIIFNKTEKTFIDTV